MQKAEKSFFGEVLHQAFARLSSPATMLANPTLFVVLITNIFLALLYITRLFSGAAYLGYHGLLLFSLCLTSLFASLAEAFASGRGRAHARALRSVASDTHALRVIGDGLENVLSSELDIGDLVKLSPGDTVPCDGEVVEGIALVNESAVTGESAPVVREAGGDISALTGGTVIVSDTIVMRVSARSGEGFLERMIQLIEGVRRRKTPNERALHVVLSGFTLIFLVVVATLSPLFSSSGIFVGFQSALDPFVAVALLVCLMPTTIGALLPAIGIAGMDRMMQNNVLAIDPGAVEVCGDVDTLLLDKTGTITFGNRRAAEFFPSEGVEIEELVRAALLSSLSDETAEGRSIVSLSRAGYGYAEQTDLSGAEFIAFSAKTRISGVDIDGISYRKGAVDAIEKLVGVLPDDVYERVQAISREGGTPLVIVKQERVLGSVFLKDIVKPGLKARFAQLRRMGIKTVMITGDNALTAAAIAAEAGVDEYFGQVTPEQKLRIIERYQGKGHTVAMTGDGSNDAPALARADVSMAMNSGTQAAREAANLVDLDSNPTKIIEAVGIGKQLLMTRGALTTFSIANDVAKYFVLIPAVSCLSVRR